MVNNQSLGCLIKHLYYKGMLQKTCSNSSPAYSLVVIALVISQISASFISMSVTASNLQINQVASYTFVVNRQFDPVNLNFIPSPTPVPIDSLITITFPSQFLTISSNSSIACTDSNGTDLGCTLNSVSRTVTVSKYYATSSTLADGLISIRMPSIINAYKSGASDNFYWQITSSTSTVIDQGPPPNTNFLSTSLTFIGASFKSCGISASSALVSVSAPLTFSLTPTNTIPSGGRIVIVIPGSWSSDPLASTTITNNPTCTEVSGIGTSNLACSYDSSQNKLTVTGITTSLSSTFSFKVSSVLTPPTVGSGEVISIFSEWSDGSSIDSCTSLVTGLVAAPFQAISLASNDNTVVQSSFSARLQLTLSRAFSYQDTIVFYLPTQFLSVSVTSVNFATMTRTPNLNQLTLSNFPSTPSTITANNQLTFTLASLTNPLSTAPISLNVTFYRSGQLYQTSTVSYSATVGTLTSFSITADSNFVQTFGQAMFSLESVLFFPAGSRITVSYPISVSASNLVSSSVTRCSLNGTIRSGVTYAISDNQIIFSNIFSSNFKGTVILIIPSFTNPPTTQPSVYNLAVSDSASYSVMTSSFTFTANTRSLISNSITSSSSTVLDTGVTITLNLQTNHPFTAISIIVPPEISIGSSFKATCAPNNFSSCSLSARNLTFIGSLPAGSYSLSWGYNTNPNSLKPTSSFSITTYFQGWPVETSTGVIRLTMTNTAAFRSFVTFPSSYKNSATISVTLSLSVPSGAPSGQFTATLPSELGLSSATCAGCTIVPPNVLYSFSSGTANLDLVINNVQNVGSFKPISSFAASLVDSDGFGSLSSSASGWSNTEPSSFTSTVSGTNNYRGESNNFLFSLSGLPGSQSYVIVTINSAFPAVTAAPTGSTRVDNYNLNYSCSSTTCSLNIPLTNPTAIGSYPFLLNTFTSDNYQVGNSTSNSWTYDCTSTNCRSCYANGTCISCYSSSLISIYTIFSISTGTCISACPSSFFLVNSTCTPCDANCSQCTTTSKRCVSCASSYYLETSFFTCVPSCLAGYFANSFNQQCDACTSPCVTCNITASTCLSCNYTTFLFGTECRTSCPAGTHVANPTTSRCDPCDSNCLTCSGSTTHCLTCNNTQSLYFQNNKCVAACSSNYFLVSNICQYCHSSCKTCGNSISSCTDCFLDSNLPVYYNETCIAASQCPIGHFVNSTNSSCETCPIVCTRCSSGTSCSLCATDYYLYESSCLLSCPNTTYQLTNTTSGYCLTCSPCATCSSVNTCTSCATGQYLYLSACYTVCPNGTYSTGTICTKCPTDCPTCQNASFCFTCVSSLYLYLGTCYSICPNGTYASGSACVSCPPSCATCRSSSSCQSCTTGFSLENSQCVLVCSVGISINQVCQPCGLNCGICSNTTGVCSLCNTDYLLYNNTCVSNCPTNMLTLNNQTCTPCSSTFVNCSICNNSQCLTCTFGQLVNGSCVPCSPGYYDLSGSCVICPSSCTTCTSQTACQTCSSGYYLLGNTCTSLCPKNMVPNGTVCSFCADSCSVCNQSNSLCTVCNAGVFLYSNLCYSTCPSPLVVSYDFLSCVTEEVYYQQFSEDAKIIPFPFTIGAVVVIIIGYILRCFHPHMYLQTALCALVSLIQFATWLVFMGFEMMYYLNYHDTAKMGFITGCVSLALLYLLNFVHLRCYFSYVATDDEFIKWYRRHSCANCAILWFATLFSFKIYRFIHSKFLGREQLSMTLSSINKLIPFSLLGILSLFLCSAPICVGCALALYNSVSKDQEFFIAFDTIVVTGIMLILILMDLRHSDDYFSDEHEAKNLKKKIYEEDSIKFEALNGEGGSDKSQGHIAGSAHEDQGELVYASTGQKFQSTFQRTKANLAQPNSETKIQGQQQDGSQQFYLQQSEGDQAMAPKGKWEAVRYDHHGYQIKYDANNNMVRYDENGYRVEIDENGNHKLYNQSGQEVRIIDGKHCIFDYDGYMLIDGKPHDQRGYQVRQEDGETVFYDHHGFKVIGYPPEEKHVDQDGNLVIVDQEGKIRRYQADGLEIVDYKGRQLLKNQEGYFVRKDKNGQWELYDPEDGFTLRIDPETEKKQKFDDRGFRIEIDQFGHIRRYDEDGNLVTILPGGVIVRYDPEGYRLEKDAEGNIHRFDSEGYERITDEQGRPKFIDQHGYTVIRDLYGRVTLYDQEGLLVIIDPETGQHRRYNEEGLEVTTDANGNRILRDKRGKIVKEIEGETFEKYDDEGNKIYLDDNGYEVEYDQEGNVLLYDKVGDRVQTEYDIEQSEEGDHFQSVLLDQKNKKSLKYRYKPTKAIDNELELQKLMSAHQHFTFDEESEISELRQFHDQDPPMIEVEHEIEKMVNKERTELKVKEDDKNQLEQLQEFQFKEELDEIQEMNTGALQGLAAQYKGSQMLLDRQKQQAEYDQEAIARGLDENDPDILAIKQQQDLAAAQARKRDLNRMLNSPNNQDPIEIKSVADVALNQRSFDNQGVQPLQNRTDYDQIGSIDELELPLGKGKGKRGNRSQAYLPNGKKDTNTVYNYNTVEVEIKNQNKLYDEDQQIQSLHEDEWHEQQPVFARERVKQGTSNANTNILYMEEDEDNKDALSDFVQHQSETKSKPKPLTRYPLHNEILSGRSIEQIQEQLFGQVGINQGLRQRKEFKLSGAPNPLVEYAKAMQANRKSLQQKMYLENYYKK